MIRYVALLRGINVGGHNIKMDVLRRIFTELGFINVSSYISSGNIFFDTNINDKKELTDLIERRINEQLGYNVPTFLRTVLELESIISLNPFEYIKPANDTRFCVVFTSTPIFSKIKLPQYSSRNDMDLVAVNPYEAFTVWHIIDGRPPSGKFDANIIPAVNTTRFYHTLIKILNAAKS